MLGKQSYTVRVCTISAGRPQSVPRVQGQFPGCIWYVPEGQQEEYVKRGAEQVVGVAGELPMKSIQLNRAIEDGFIAGADIVTTVDDDIVKCLDSTTRKSLNLMSVVSGIADELLHSPYYLGGPFSGTNTKHSPGKTVHYGRVPGAMMLHRRRREGEGKGLIFPAFDNDIVGMEDLDYVIQHHVYCCGVLLAAHYCLENLWSDNKGGYQDYRTTENIASTVAKLKSKWGACGCNFKVDESRKNMIAFRVPWKRLSLDAQFTRNRLAREGRLTLEQ